MAVGNYWQKIYVLSGLFFFKLNYNKIKKTKGTVTFSIHCSYFEYLNNFDQQSCL